MAEASGGRTHRRRGNPTPAGFEDRDDHRTACASVLRGSGRACSRTSSPIYPKGRRCSGRCDDGWNERWNDRAATEWPIAEPAQSDSLEVSADGRRNEMVNTEKHLSAALSPLPNGKHLPLFDLPRLPQDAPAMSGVRPQV